VFALGLFGALLKVISFPFDTEPVSDISTGFSSPSIISPFDFIVYLFLLFVFVTTSSVSPLLSSPFPQVVYKS
jgi:hypothetical protein